jgi:signal transduction histidine kinase
MNRMQRCAEIILADHAAAGDLEQNDMEMLNFIATSATAAQKMVKELAVYLSAEVSHRKDMQDFELFNLLSLVVEQNDELIKERNAQILLHDNLHISIQGNNAQLYLLFQNLLQNAIRYCTKMPQISITLERINRSLNEGVLSITDNGIGIDERFIAEIFQPFTRMHKDLNAEGTGLGLSIVKRIVHNHSGSIEVKSQVGQGTKFSITLPLRQG